MAGGKLSARQKMINLMYLVFIAMLAIKMDKEVLTAFGRVNDTLASTNIAATKTNAATLTQLEGLANDQAVKYQPLNTLAKSINTKSSTFYNYLDGIGSQMRSSLDDPNNYETMDNAEAVDKLFFKDDGFTEEGTLFVDNINNYREDVLKLLPEGFDEEIVAKIKTRFNTEPINKGKATEQAWLKNRYEEFPLVASLTNVTKIQSDIKATESEIYSSLIGGQMKSDVSMKNYEAMVVFDKNAYYPGERLEGKIVLGKKDNSLTATKVIVNGAAVAKSNIQAGQVKLSRSAGSVGERELKGKFYFMENGEEIPIDITGGKYSVIPEPNTAVVSADKMNVVYRGLKNPITISIPGLSSNKVRASAPGLVKSSGDSYIMQPPASREVVISVSGTLPSGKSITKTKKFRVKGLPAPTGVLSGQSGYLKMSKGNLVRKSVSAELKDFVFDLNVSVSSFKVKVPGKPTIDCPGTKFNSKAIRAIQKSKKGDAIIIFDIKSAFSGSSQRPKKTSQITVEITS